MESHQSNKVSQDIDRISDKGLLAAFVDELEKILQQNGQLNGITGSADPFHVNGDNYDDLLRKSFVERDDKCPNCSYVNAIAPKNDSLGVGLFQVPNTVKQPELYYSRLTDYIKGKSEQISPSEYSMGCGVQENIVEPSKESRNGTGSSVESSEELLLTNQAPQQQQMDG